MKKIIYFYFVLLHIVLSQQSYATQGKTITKFEWDSWPYYCKAGFANSGWAHHIKYTRELNRQWVIVNAAKANKEIDIPGFHHFCVGMTYVHRARSATKKKPLLKYAINEMEYVYTGIKPSSPGYSIVTAFLGKAYFGIGEYKTAIIIWSDGITTKPKSPESYLAYSEALMSKKKYEDALRLLLKFYDFETKNNSEIEYFLGHAYLNLKQYDKAREHADKAYQLGYQLLGLKIKLDKIKQ